MNLQPPLLAGKPVKARIMIFSGILILSVSVFTMISLYLLEPFFGINMLALQEMNEHLDSPAFLRALEFLQIVQALGLFIVPVMVFSWLTEKNLVSYPGLNQGVPIISIISVFALILAAQPIINWMAEWNSKMTLPVSLHAIQDWMKYAEEEAATLTEAFLTIKTPIDFVIVFIMVAVLPAIGEEMLFRGVIQKLLKEWLKNAHLAIFISAFLFSALHMQFFGFVPRLLLGMLLGYLLEWSGSLWLPVAAHFINNGSAVILSYFQKQGKLNFDPDKIGTGENSTFMLIVCLAIVSLLIVRLSKTKQETEIRTDVE